MKLLRLSLLAAGCLLAACVLPQKEEPHSSLLDTQALGLSGAPVVMVDSDWWTAFGDPQLNVLIEQALANNPTLAEAVARVRGAQALAQISAAGNKPGVTLDASTQRQKLSENYIYAPDIAGFNPHGGGVYWFTELGLNFTWNLDFWGRQAQLIEQAKSQTAAAELDAAAARLALAGSIAQAYVDLYRAYAMADVAEEYVREREDLLRLTQQRVQAGLDTQLELQTAATLLPQARATLLQAQGQRELAVHRLAALTGHGAEQYAQYQRPQLKLDAALPLPDSLPMDLLAHRPDVLAARARVSAAAAGREAAHAAFYPDISLNAFAGYRAISLDDVINPANKTYGAGPALHLPIFDAKRIRGAYRAATADLDLAVARYNDAVLNAVNQAADQLSLGESLAQQRQQQSAAHDAAVAAFTVARQRYAAGLNSQIAVLNLETQALNTRRDIINTNCNLIISRVSLLLTLGGSFQPQQSPPVSAHSDGASS